MDSSSPTARAVPRLDIAPYDAGAALALERALGVSDTLAQVLVRRGLRTPEAAQAFLAAEDRHDPSAFAGIDAATGLILSHVQAGTRITVHGDYDADGVCSTAVLIRALRRLGADPDWFLPGRVDDGYGLSADTIQRLTVRGTRLLVTVDCAVTAVDEVAAARAAGMDVVVTDHHRPRVDGVLPDAPLVHPELSGYPCPHLCAAGVAHKLAEALAAAAGADHAAALAEDLDLVGIATVADCVPLLGENRRFVREGLRALANTPKPGLRALMAVAQVDPGSVDARAVGFRLAPRLNAAGRLQRADAGLELALTEDPGRAEAIAAELHRLNAERRDVETRILFEAEAQARDLGDRPAYVLAGEGWHPGVIGIVASRIAERRHRPAVLIALDGATGTGSGRSIPAFDLLAGLEACASVLNRHGGHRAAAGLEIDAARVDEFRAGFEAHAAAVLSPEDLIPAERVDAIVTGDALGMSLAEELGRLAPHGQANPAPNLLLPACRLEDPRPMGEGKHLRFTVASGGARSRAVAFGSGSRLPVAPAAPGEDPPPADATFALEINRWNGAVEPRLVLGSARPSEPAPIDVLGEPAGPYLDAVLAELDAPLAEPDGAVPLPPPGREPVDRRGRGLAGTVASLVASGEPVLVVAADVPTRLAGLSGRLGGFALCSHDALEREPALADPFVHVVALDPPATPRQAANLDAGPGGFAHRAWGEPELRFAEQINELEYGLRAPLAALYTALRDRSGAAGEELEALLREDGGRGRSPALAGRLLRVLGELRLVSLDRDRLQAGVPPAQRTELQRSAAYRHYRARHEDGHRFLSRATAARAA